MIKRYCEGEFEFFRKQLWGGAYNSTVFDDFSGDETVIYVNFAQYSVIKPPDGEENL